MKEIIGLHYQSMKKIKLLIKNEYIYSIEEVNNSVDDTDFIIIPGLVDLQINGYKGIDFNKRPLTPKEWHESIDLLLREGVTSFYPTIITNSYENLINIFKLKINKIR